MKTAEQTFNEFYDLISDRLNQLGPISSAEMWTLYRDHFSYSYIIVSFRKIMVTMVEQGKAVADGKGKWIISKANETRQIKLEQCPLETTVITYFGLVGDVNENSIIKTDFGQLCNLLAFYEQELERKGLIKK